MAGLKQIKSRLKSVSNTKKITYAMKLVSAAKLRKAQLAVTNSREYTAALAKLASSVAQAIGAKNISHPLAEKREQVKRIRVIVIGGARGLCGGYNVNVNRRVEASVAEWKTTQPGVQIEWVVLGKKPAEYFRRTRRDVKVSFDSLAEEPAKWPIDQICTELERDFISGEIDQAYVIYTQFRSAMNQSAICEKLLPVDADFSTEAVGDDSGTTLFEPSAEEVFAAILPRVVRAKVLQGGLDARASEHGSRMTAMDAATKNADELSYKLRILRNKLRQTGITSQLLDIVGGAEALNK